MFDIIWSFHLSRAHNISFVWKIREDDGSKRDGVIVRFGDEVNYARFHPWLHFTYYDDASSTMTTNNLDST